MHFAVESALGNCTLPLHKKIIRASQAMDHPSQTAALQHIRTKPFVAQTYPNTILNGLIHWIPPGSYSVQSDYQGHLSTTELSASIGVFMHDAQQHKTLLAHINTDAQAHNLSKVLQQNRFSESSSVHLIGGDASAELNNRFQVLTNLLIEQGYHIKEINIRTSGDDPSSIAIDLNSGEISNSQAYSVLMPVSLWQKSLATRLSDDLVEYS